MRYRSLSSLTFGHDTVVSLRRDSLIHRFAQEILSGFSSIPTSPNQCAGSCSHDRIFGVDLDEGDCPFSASIGLMPAAVLLTLMALLALF